MQKHLILVLLPLTWTILSNGEDYQVQKNKSSLLEEHQRIKNLSNTVQKQSKEKVILEQKVKDLRTEKKKKVKF